YYSINSFFLSDFLYYLLIVTFLNHLYTYENLYGLFQQYESLKVHLQSLII
ncbi:hypothetical protein GLOIN_2v1556614, partial [Rhizophagus irregularis DAOM 181602=DAOM 197198]